MRAAFFRALFGLAALIIGARHAAAGDLLGFYAGAEIGESRVAATGELIETPAMVYYQQGNIDQDHAAFQLLAGLRPVSLLGAELDYFDLGRPSGAFNAYPGSVSMKGGAAFGLLYLPVPVIDVFLKAGVARIQSDVNGTGVYGPNCSSTLPCPQYLVMGPFDLARTNTGGAAGIGAQLKFGSLAVRAEYERFSAAGEHPSLAAVGVSWSF